MSTVDASAYSFATSYKIGEYNYPFLAKQTIFWRGTNGYYGAWRIDGISATYVNPNYYGRLNVGWFFHTNGSPYFDAGIRAQDLDGNTRPAETAYDMGAYEITPPDTTPDSFAFTDQTGGPVKYSDGIQFDNGFRDRRAGVDFDHRGGV